MVARLWFEKIINGDKTFEQVPPGLKESVKKLLVQSGRKDLVK